MNKSGILLRICLLAIALCIPIRADAAQQAVTAGQGAEAAAAPFQGDVYILSGGFGIFSTGLSKLGAQLKQNGATASLVSYQIWRSVAQKSSTIAASMGASRSSSSVIRWVPTMRSASPTR